MTKPTLNLSQAFNRALSAYNAGKLVEAEQICQQIINTRRDLFEALHLLAVVQSSLGKKETALASYRRALKVRPGSAEALSNRGLTLHELRRYGEALASYDRALNLQSDFVEALANRAATLHKLRRFEEALASLDRALILRPDYAEALMTRGTTLHDLRRFDAALASYDRALTVRPDYAEALSNRGVTLHELKRFEEALASFDRALSLRPNYVETLMNRGVTLNALKRLDEALASYDRALALRPDYPEALSNRGNTLRELTRFEEALASYDRALDLQPDFLEALSNRGIILHELNRFDEALTNFERALTLRPDHAEALSNRANTLYQLNRFEEALASCDRALSLQPDFVDALLNRGEALDELKRYEEALASLDRALALRPDSAEAFSNRGRTLHKLNRSEEAMASYERALALNPDLSIAHNNVGLVLEEFGRLHEAQQAYLEALRLDPNLASAYNNLAGLKTFSVGDPILMAMETLAAKNEGMSKTAPMQLDFALGKAYADLKDYRRSFKHLRAGNASKRAMISYDEQSAFAFFDRIEAVFTPELIAAKSGGGDPSPMPVFVLGMPRSGTTLVEQILASHPLVHGAGELQIVNDVIRTVRGRDGSVTAFPEFVPALDASAFSQIGAHYVTEMRQLAPKGEGVKGQRVTDKMPSNYYFAGLIHLVLPNAKIIHTIRDSVDTCVSCFAKLFSAEQNHTYDLSELGRYYKRYEQLMGHWRRVLPAGRILDVHYENVVADPEGEVRRILSYCGLPWDDRCLSFYNTDRPVRTASAAQVRQPIYNSAVGRWHLYEEHLGPLLHALGTERPVDT
jgi:tetratricopeptide (TPR) repeat protein